MLGKGKGNQKKKLMKTVQRFLRKLKIKVSYDPTIPPVGIYTKKTKSLTQKNKKKPKNCTHVHCSIIYNSQDMKTFPPSMDEWIKKMWNTHKHTQNIIRPLKKKEVLPCMTTWMDLKGIMQSEISPTDKNMYCILFSCRIFKKKKQLIDTENRLMDWLPGAGSWEDGQNG